MPTEVIKRAQRVLGTVADDLHKVQSTTYEQQNRAAERVDRAYQKHQEIYKGTMNIGRHVATSSLAVLAAGLKVPRLMTLASRVSGVLPKTISETVDAFNTLASNISETVNQFSITPNDIGARGDEQVAMNNYSTVSTLAASIASLIQNLETALKGIENSARNGQQ